MALAGAPLTMASIAVLPVLLGLGVDYAIQYQARPSALPTIATAALATAVGFLVLVLSPVPMVQGFGLLLMVGIAVAFGLALTAGTAVVVLAERRRGDAGVLASSLRGAGELVDGLRDGLGRLVAPAGRAFGRVGGAVLRAGMARPGRVLAVGLLIALVGWGLDSRTEVVSDIDRLVPAGPARRARPRRAADLDRRGRRDRRDRRRRRPDRSQGRGLDALLPVTGLLKAHGYTTSAAAARRTYARRCRCPTCSAPARPRRRRPRSTGCSTRCRRTSRRR